MTNTSTDDADSSSGDDKFEAKFEVPNVQLISRIVQQVEALFSDENLIRDEFMFKNIHKNKDGFVNLKLITAFKKVKNLSKDWRVVAYAIAQSSTSLVLNEERNKVRRKQALHPMDSGSKYDRTVFVVNLPAEKEDVNQLHRDFAVFGRIGLIRILRPSRNGAAYTGPTTEKVLATLAQQVPSMDVGKAVGAVEFNFIDDARSCLQSQRRLIAFDAVWSKVTLCIVNKSNADSTNMSSFNIPEKHVLNLPDLCSTVINKPKDDDSMIVITVTKGSITLMTTTKSNGQRPVQTLVQHSSQSSPDGSPGFRRG